MQGKASVVNHVQFKDNETLKREERKRRRLLRLQQVRQQSKDVASLVRQKVRSERDKQHGLAQERVEARTQQWKVRTMKGLQSEFKSILKNVGKGHVAASQLPDEEMLRKAESERNTAAAQQRGQEAFNRVKEEEAARRKVDEERRLQLQNVRAVEEARSAAVVALPCPESTVGLRNIPSKTPVPVVVPPEKTASKSGAGQSCRVVIPEWPKRSWTHQTLPLGIIPDECEQKQGDSDRNHNENLGEGDGFNKHHATILSCEGSVQPTYLNIAEKPYVNQPAKCTRSNTRPPEIYSSNSDVKLYDYSSCYQSQYDKKSGFVEKVEPGGQINAKEAADREVSAVVSQSRSNASALEREQQRGRIALQRVHVQRDYKDMMASLSVLAKQKASLCGYGNIAGNPRLESQSRHDQLTSAVENLLQDAEINGSNSLVDPHSSHTPDGSLVVSQLDDTPGSVPKLNLGRWQYSESVPGTSQGVSSSLNGSFIVSQPYHLPSTIGLREEHFGRGAAGLTTLVQLINEERHLLFSGGPLEEPSQDASQGSSLEKNAERDQLQEIVVQQRKQLKMQKSEVERLEASLGASDRIPKSSEVVDRTSRLSSTPTHESITVEPSHSEDSPDSLSSPPDYSFGRAVKERACRRSEEKRRKEKSFLASPTKDGVMYSMDLSLSSVVMDQTESSSGSKSLSVHGVQVLVKVCGADKDTSESRSASNSVEVKRGARVIELPNDSVDARIDVGKKIVESENSGKIKPLKKIKQRSRAKETKELCREPASSSSRFSEEDKSNYDQQKEIKLKSAKRSKKDAEKIDGKKSNDFVSKDKKDGKRTEESESNEKENHDQPASTSTSYLSPPDRVLSSLTEDIKTLIALASSRNIQPQHRNRSRQSDISQSVPLLGYINRLLAMSRESIDRLNVSCSEVSTPSSTIFNSVGSNVEHNLTDTEYIEPAQEQETISSNENQDQIDCHQSMNDHLAKEDQWVLPSAFNNPESLTDMTKQCHEKISALTRMIEEVRRQGAVISPTQNESDHSSQSQNLSRTPGPLDSTAYMSPPPQVLQWADIAFPSGSAQERENRLSLDPYGAAVMQLLADVRSSMVPNSAEPSSAPLHTISPSGNFEKLTGNIEPSHTRSKPPVAFWKTIDRCNVTSPTEPHELSTIPELGTTLPESLESQGSGPGSPIQELSPESTMGTPPDVIAELMRRNLLTSPFAWAKKLDKQKQFHSSYSNTSPKNSQDSDLSSGKAGTGQSDISASRETNTLSMRSQTSSSMGSKDWKTNILMSPVDLYSSADEVEGGFRRMGIGWVGAMLRKTKEAGALSSTSSSDSSPIKIDNPDFKTISDITDEEPIVSSPLTAALRRERSHSTPIKGAADRTSSSGSHLV